jgi:hypothetical protein
MACVSKINELRRLFFLPAGSAAGLSMIFRVLPLRSVSLGPAPPLPLRPAIPSGALLRPDAQEARPAHISLPLSLSPPPLPLSLSPLLVPACVSSARARARVRACVQTHTHTHTHTGRQVTSRGAWSRAGGALRLGASPHPTHPAGKGALARPRRGPPPPAAAPSRNPRPTHPAPRAVDAISLSLRHAGGLGGGRGYGGYVGI